MNQPPRTGRGGRALSESGTRRFQREGRRERGEGAGCEGGWAVCPQRAKGWRLLVKPDQVGTGVAAVVAAFTGVIGIGLRQVHRRQAVSGLTHTWPGKGPGGPVAEDREGQLGSEDAPEHVGDLGQRLGLVEDWSDC